MKRVALILALALATLGAKCDGKHRTRTRAPHTPHHQPVSAVPEPSADVLFGVGALGLVAWNRRRSRR